MSMQLQPYEYYHLAISKPGEVEERVLLDLIQKFPYSQPLRYALERHKLIKGMRGNTGGAALLFAPNVDWLWQYMRSSPEKVGNGTSSPAAGKVEATKLGGEHSDKRVLPKGKDPVVTPPIKTVVEKKVEGVAMKEVPPPDSQQPDSLINKKETVVNVVPGEAILDQQLDQVDNKEVAEKVEASVTHTSSQNQEVASNELDELSSGTLPNEDELDESSLASQVTFAKEDEPGEPAVKEQHAYTAHSPTSLEEDVLDKLVENGVASDYLAYQEFTQKEQEEVVATENASNQVQHDEENISLYNDELMPYSFRWWLHKTRLAHAKTYRPFASPSLPKPQKGQFDPRKLDETILDQQIKESIIHFQDPEMKLSDSVKEREPFVVAPKKSDAVIERFIREEPIIHPPSVEQLNTENMARQSAEDNYALVTETLANIYLDQGLYRKAIEVFKKLILKYPEKKSYFAIRIQEIERNLQ